MQVFKGFLIKELTQTIRNPVMVFALLLMPVFQCFLLSYAVSNEARNLSIVVSAPADDVLMRRIYEHCLATELFIPVKGYQQIGVVAQPFELVKQNRADLVLVAPPEGLTRLLRSGKPVTLQALIDASNVLTAQSVSSFTQSIVNTVLVQELTKNSGDTINNHTTAMVNFSTRILFNPEMNTKFFIVPSIMAMTVSTAIFSLVCIGITKEKENGTIETLLSAPISKIELIIGKTVPYLAIAMINFLSVCALGLLVFHLPFRGSVWMLAFTFLSFSFAMAMLGVFVSNFCHTQQQSLLGLMMILFVMMMLSGSMFAVDNMPLVLKLLANMNPMTHFNYLVRNVILKECGWQYCLAHNYPMWLFGLLFGLLGMKRLKQTI